MKRKRKKLIGYMYKDWSWRISERGDNLYINQMGINIVTPEYRKKNNWATESYPKKVKIIIEEI